MAYYKFLCKNSGKALNLYTDASGTTIPNGTRFSLWTDNGSSDQAFEIEALNSTDNLFKIKRNTGYVLNRHSSNNYAIAWPRSSASAADSYINSETTNGNMRLKLTRQSNMYLTAADGTNGAIVRWQGKIDSSDQYWTMVEVGGGPTPGGIVMPVNANQKYSGNSQWIKDWGCAVCCGVDLASWKNRVNYSISDFSNYYYADGRGYTWTGPSNFSASLESTLNINEAQTIARIRQIIRSGKPVACHAAGGNGHWFVAYAESGSGTTWATSGITVLDPVGSSTSTTGAVRGIWDAMKVSSATLGVDQLRIP